MNGHAERPFEKRGPRLALAALSSAVSGPSAFMRASCKRACPLISRVRLQSRPLRARAPFASDHAWCARVTEHRPACVGIFRKIMNIYFVIFSLVFGEFHIFSFARFRRVRDGRWLFEKHVDSPLARWSWPLSLPADFAFCLRVRAAIRSTSCRATRLTSSYPALASSSSSRR